MSDSIRFEQRAACEVVRSAVPSDQIHCRGRFQVEHWRDNQLIGKYDFCNAIVNEGKNKLLDVMFHAVAAINTWYVLLINNSPEPTLAAADTYAQINGTNDWVEWDDYDEATRLEWTEGAASSQSITNAAPLVFTISDSGTVYGLAVVGGGTAPGTKNNADGGGVLWGEAQFASGPVAVLDNDQLKVTYTVNA